MRNFLLLAGFFLLGFAQIFAQQPNPTPEAPVVNQNPSRTAQMRERNPVVRPGITTDNLVLRQMILQASVQPLYRKPTREELKNVAPDSNLLRLYGGFLRQDNTGLFKLLADMGCAGNTKIVIAKEECLRFSMPGAGNSFSFRTNNYRIRHLADLTFTGKSLHVTGVLMHGIMVNLGDVPLESVTLQTSGLKFLNEFQPVDDFEKAKAIDQQFIKGVSQDGFLYSRTLEPAENATFVLRSIAYNGKVMRSIRGIPYNELDFDKRKDVMIAFRVVRRDADGSLTILWKELSKKNAPKFKRKFNDSEAKFKENKFVANNKSE